MPQFNCTRKTFILDYTYQGYRPEVKQQIAEMAINGSGIRDTGRVLGISSNTVIKELKKSMRFAFNPPQALNKCDTLPVMPHCLRSIC
ncbi:MAG: hypothetical protein DCF20_03430 [Pseudanabaena sp.]|nr:MAG: hypothetical protein DCF20_03430 [Pseudanabaena sp.]